MSQIEYETTSHTLSAGFGYKPSTKVEIAIVRGKRQYDRRHEIAKRDSDRAIDRALASRNASDE